MADTKGSALSTFTPVLTDKILGIDDPGGTPVSGTIEGTALLALMKTSMDTYYYGKANVAYTTAAFSKTSNTTLANITGLTHTLEASGVYRFSSVLFITCNASGGAKSAISGTCTATSIIYTGFSAASGGWIANGGAIRTALDTLTLGSTSAVTLILTYGVITVANAGTLTVQFAQNASYGTASTVYAGSWFECEKLN